MYRVVREMGITHAELFRLLPAATGLQEFDVSDKIISIRNGEKVINIRISPEIERRLGSLRLPVTVLEFSFSGYAGQEISKFFRRFDRCFRRCGG